jgi:outer membrane protein assembly factor BamE (lipoprotein component of BamABCDE complex)
MRTHQVTLLLLLAFFVTGCRPSAESEKRDRLKAFSKQMDQRSASVTLGMARSDVIEALGQPFWTTNTSHQTVDIYTFEPPVRHWGVVTNGFEIFFSNNIVIQKSPIKGISK